MCGHIHQCLGSQDRKLLGTYVGMAGWAGEAAAVLGESVFVGMCSSQALYVYKAVSSCWVTII